MAIVWVDAVARHRKHWVYAPAGRSCGRGRLTDDFISDETVLGVLQEKPVGYYWGMIVTYSVSETGNLCKAVKNEAHRSEDKGTNADKDRSLAAHEQMISSIHHQPSNR